MNDFEANLAHCLRLAAVLQLAIAVVNLGLVRLLSWQEALAQTPLLLREVFQVHLWFISVTLAIFGLMTWRFADDLARGAHPIGQWLAAGIGAFWGIRAALQCAYYSSSHWRGHVFRTFVHAGLLLLYGGFGVLYGIIAFAL